MANHFIDEAASATLGAAKQVKATFTGVKGVFKTLMKEHGEVSALLMHVSKTTDPGVRAELYPQIRSALLAHEHGEVNAVYPTMARFSELRDISVEHRQEANELEMTIRALDQIEYTAPTWPVAFERLFDLVKQHVKEEESDFFPRAQKVLGDEQVKAMEAEYLAAKEGSMA